ncbi:MAG: J domain-containing protein [Aestuariivirga sp.]
MSGNSAITDAINVFKQPARLHGLWKHGLPLDTLQVIKIAAGDADSMTAATKDRNIDEAELREAADFYLRQMFMQAGPSRHRLLGLAPQASLDELRIHRRWLLKWLHPDRAGSKWRAAYFKQISDAAKSLELELGGTTDSSVAAAPRSMGVVRIKLSRKRTLTLNSALQDSLLPSWFHDIKTMTILGTCLAIATGFVLLAVMWD